MSVLVTDAGFVADDWRNGWLDWEVATHLGGQTDAGFGLDLPNDVLADAVPPYFDGAAAIRVSFPSFADGRGFSVARQLQLLGYRGRLRAAGHVIADQYAMARRCGFDEVEISDELAVRQPQSEWLARANWQAHNYQARLRAAV